MFVSVVSSISSSSLQRPDRTAENGPGKVFNLVHDAGSMTFSVESEGKETGSFYAINAVPSIIKGVCPADLCSDLSDVAIAVETGRVSVFRWCVVQVVLSCNPGQVTRQLRVDGRILGALRQEWPGTNASEIKGRTTLRGGFKNLFLLLCYINQ